MLKSASIFAVFCLFLACHRQNVHAMKMYFTEIYGPQTVKVECDTITIIEETTKEEVSGEMAGKQYLELNLSSTDTPFKKVKVSCGNKQKIYDVSKLSGSAGSIVF